MTKLFIVTAVSSLMILGLVVLVSGWWGKIQVSSEVIEKQLIVINEAKFRQTLTEINWPPYRFVKFILTDKPQAKKLYDDTTASFKKDIFGRTTIYLNLNPVLYSSNFDLVVTHRALAAAEYALVDKYFDPAQAGSIMIYLEAEDGRWLGVR